MEESFDLSIIILTWNSKEFIERCIKSIYNNIDDVNFEVLVVDNGSKDGTKKILENYMNQYNNFRVIFLERNLGTTKSRNIGIKEAKGEYILFLDSDAEIKKDAISKLLETFYREKNVGAVAPKILGSNGEIQYSCKKFPTLPIKVMKFLGSLKIFRRLKNMAEQLELYDEKVYEEGVHEVDYCITACLLTKREMLNKICLFDENIFYAPEDVDLCLRLWINGFKVLYNGNAEAIHHSQRLSYRSFKVLFSHFCGLVYYFKKHGYLFSRRSLYKMIDRNK